MQQQQATRVDSQSAGRQRTASEKVESTVKGPMSVGVNAESMHVRVSKRPTTANVIRTRPNRPMSASVIRGPCAVKVIRQPLKKGANAASIIKSNKNP